MLIADFSDACSVSLAKKFAKCCKQIAKEYEGQAWGYLSKSDRYYAATPDAEAILVGAYQYCMENGCTAEAYCNKSAVGIAQLARIRQAAGINSDIQKVCFEEAEEALQHLTDILTKVGKDNN